MWMIAESSISAVQRNARLADGINMLINGSACCAFIVWYLHRERERDEDRHQTVEADRDHLIATVTNVVYPVAFQDGIDHERQRQADQENLATLVSLDEYRGTAGHPAR